MSVLVFSSCGLNLFDLTIFFILIIILQTQLLSYKSAFLCTIRYLSYDPSVSPEDNTSKQILSEKYAQLLSYMESVGFTNEVITVLIYLLRCTDISCYWASDHR